MITLVDRHAGNTSRVVAQPVHEQGLDVGLESRRTGFSAARASHASSVSNDSVAPAGLGKKACTRPAGVLADEEGEVDRQMQSPSHWASVSRKSGQAARPAARPGGSGHPSAAAEEDRAGVATAVQLPARRARADGGCIGRQRGAAEIATLRPAAAAGRTGDRVDQGLCSLRSGSTVITDSSSRKWPRVRLLSDDVTSVRG